eukprot:gene25064-10716_t
MHAQAKEGRGYPAPCSSLRGKLFSQSETSEDFLTNNSLSQQKRSYQLSRPRERWTEEERAKFLEGLRIYGRGQWKKIGEFIGTKTAVQIRSHAQKVLGKMATQEQKPQEQQQALNFQWLGGRSTTQATANYFGSVAGGDQGSSPEAAGNTGPATGPAISNTAARQHYPNTGPTSAHPAEAMTRTISYNVKESMIRWANVQGLGSREGAGGQSGSRSSIPHMKTIEAVASAAAAAAAAAAKAVLMAAGGDVARKIHMRAAAGMLPHLLNPLSFVQPLQAAANQRKTMGQSQDLLTEGKLDVAGKDKPRIIPVQVRNCESSDRQTPKPSAAADALLQQLGSYPRAIAANCDLESGSRLAQERRQLTPPSGNHNFRSGSGSGSGDNAGSGGGGGSGSGGAADFEIQHGSGGSGNNTDRHPNALGQQRPNQLLEGSHNLQHPKLWKQRPSSLLAEPTAVAASGSDQAQQSQQQLLPPLVLKPQVRQPYLLSLHRRHQHQEDQDHQHHQHQHHHHAQAPERKHLHSLSPEPHIGPKSSTPPPGFGLPSNLSSGSRPKALKAARQQNEATPSLQTQSSIPTLWQQMLVPSLLDPKAMGQLGAQGVQQSLQQLLFGAAVADPKAMGQLGAQGVQQSLQQLLFGAAVVDPPVGAPLLQHAALPPLANQEDINKVRATATEAFAHNGLTREQSQQLTQVASALQLANTLAGPLAASLQMPNPNEVQRSSRMAAASGGLDAPSAYIASCNIDTAAQVEAKPPGFNASTREVSASTPQDVLLRSEKDAKANGGKACRLSADPEGTPPTEQQLVMEAAPPRVRTSRRTPPGSGQGDDGGGASSHLSWSAGSEETPNGSDTDEEGEGDEGQGEGADTPGDLADKMVDGQQPRYRYSTLGLELPWSIKQRQEQHRQHVVLPASAPLTQGAQDRPGQDDARMDVGRDEEENISDHRADAGGGGADARPQGPPPPVGNGQHWKQRLKQQRRMHVISPAGSGASSSGVQAGGGERSLGQDVANCPKAGVYRYGERGENVFEQDTATSNGDLDPAGASASRGPSRPISIHICKTRPALLTSPQKGVPPMSLNPALLLLQRLHNTAAIPQGLGNTRPNGTMGGSIDELGCVRAGTSNESGSLEGSVQGSNEPGPDGASWKKVRRLSQPEGQQLFCTIPALQDAPPPGAAHMQGLSSGLPGVNNLANLQAGLVPALSSGGLYEGGRDAALVLCHVTRRLSHTTREDGNAVENHVGPDVNGQDDNDDEEYLNLPNGPAASTDAYVGKQAQGSSGGHDGSNEPGEMGSTPYNGMGSAPHNGMGSAPHNGMVSREGGSSSNGNSGTHNGDGPAEVATVGADAGAAEFGAASADFHASAAKISAVAAENSAAAARMSIAAAGAATVVKDRSLMRYPLRHVSVLDNQKHAA